MPAAPRYRRLTAAPLAAVLLLAAGCGGKTASVSGTVTYDGHPVRSGFITFFPAEGAGSARGTAIEDGRYIVAKLAPGKHRVVVRAQPLVRAVSDGRGGTQLRADPPPVPDNAGGNNQVVEIGSGPQTVDVTLTKPK